MLARNDVASELISLRLRIVLEMYIDARAVNLELWKAIFSSAIEPSDLAITSCLVRSSAIWGRYSVAL